MIRHIHRWGRHLGFVMLPAVVATIYRNQFTIATDDGAWIGDPAPGLLTGQLDGAPSIDLFTGEGAFDGLQAVATVGLDSGIFTLQGHVVQGGFPELPER